MSGALLRGSARGGTNRLTPSAAAAYSGVVPEKEGAWGESQNRQGRTDGAMPFFFVRAYLRMSPMDGDGGRAARFAGFLCHLSLNPAICRPPRLRAGCTVHQPTLEAIMPSTITSVQSHSEQIRRLAGIADTIGAMLSVFDLLPSAGQEDALAVSASLADDLAQELAAIVGGAA